MPARPDCWSRRSKTTRVPSLSPRGDKSVNALKLMALMGMGIKCGDTVTVTVEGSDEDTTAPALKQFFETNL